MTTFGFEEDYMELIAKTGVNVPKNIYNIALYKKINSLFLQMINQMLRKGTLI
jgi:hypothetical protein